MLAVGLLLPSNGDHSAFNPKALSLYIALIATICHAFTARSLNYNQIRLVIVVASIVLLLVWEIFVFHLQQPLQDSHTSFGQFKIFATTVLVAFMMIYWHLDGGVPFGALLKTVLISNMVYSAVKMVIMVAVLLGFLDIFTVLGWGFSAMTTGIGENLIRLQTSTDIPTPYLLFFAFMAPSLGVKLSRSFITLYTLLSLSTLFFSFSRYLWAVAAVGYVASLWSYSALGVAKRAMLGAILLAIAVASIGIEESTNIVWSRFFSDETKYSDFQRYEQVDALVSKFQTGPCLGHGLGSYSEECIRASAQPFSYEVQWVSFLMQFGLIGCSILALTTLTMGWAYLSPPWTITKLSFLAMYLLWLASGFTNPFLISMNSGTLFGLFYVIGLRLFAQNRQAGVYNTV